MVDVISLPADFPDIGIPKVILDDMTTAQVEAFIADMNQKLVALKRWNTNRDEPPMKPHFFQGVPFPLPEQYAWRDKTKPDQ